MLSPRTAKTIATTRQKMFLASIMTLAVAQLIAFWMLCNHQVRQAQARDTSEVRTAAAPQQHDPNALLAASENTAQPGAPVGRPTPVNFNLR
jgi:hypothetical protein